MATYEKHKIVTFSSKNLSYTEIKMPIINQPYLNLKGKLLFQITEFFKKGF